MILKTVPIVLPLGLRQFELYQANKAGYIQHLITCPSLRGILSTTFEYLVRMRLVPSIAAMSVKEKQDAADYAQEIAEGRLERRGLVDLVKSLIVLEYFLSQ